MAEFAGIYVHGYNRPFSLSRNLSPLTSFRYCSKKEWPLYLFYAVAGDIEEAVKYFGNIIPVQIKPMLCIKDYDDFMMRQCYHMIQEENTLNMHQDGFLLKKGWEDFAIGYDYLGASWRSHIPNFDYHYKNNPFAKFKGYENINTDTTVGNGGFCFRKKSKMLKVEQSVDWSTQDGDHLPDDVFFSFWGFGQGIFKPVSIEIADQWSCEPFNPMSDSFGFHGR